LTTEAHAAAPREHPWRMPANWWTRNRRYFLYVVREFTVVPIAAWLLWLLVEIKRADGGPAHYYPPSSTAFVVFSVIVLLFSLYHSFTFLSLAGVIIHVKVLDRPVPSRLIVLAQFALWAVASVVVGFVLIWFAR
jgi:fumarate reductase subunit C